MNELQIDRTYRLATKTYMLKKGCIVKYVGDDDIRKTSVIVRVVANPDFSISLDKNLYIIPKDAIEIPNIKVGHSYFYTLGNSERVFVKVLKDDGTRIRPYWCENSKGQRFYAEYYELELETQEVHANLTIYREGQKIIAENLFSHVKGIARCNPNDKFNFMYGAQIALQRLAKIEAGKFFYADIAFPDNSTGFRIKGY